MIFKISTFGAKVVGKTKRKSKAKVDPKTQDQHTVEQPSDGLRILARMIAERIITDDLP